MSVTVPKLAGVVWRLMTSITTSTFAGMLNPAVTSVAVAVTLAGAEMTVGRIRVDKGYTTLRKMGWAFMAI